MSEKEKLKFANSFYFYLTLRFLAILCCVIVLCCVGLTQYWTNKTSAIFGMIFVIISLLFIGSSISILFVWDIRKSTLVKRCLFVFVSTLSILIAGIMFLVANDGCDQKLRTQFGCYENTSTGTFSVPAAFCFIILVFGIIDIGLNSFFYWRESKKDHIYDIPPAIQPISIIDTEKSIHDLYTEYQRKGQTTSV
ncbi:unnamed protein product [Caenorhabditis angaria]|uniref:MARVEL domain-containing protein n=1 Tax=Caenorhabditis angaria TaxID=860376 RepID=A0A9P1IBI8_9PELO|nr:unnamed protein product [Caenorhabditis angaria]